MLPVERPSATCRAEGYEKYIAVAAWFLSGAARSRNHEVSQRSTGLRYIDCCQELIRARKGAAWSIWLRWSKTCERNEAGRRKRLTAWRKPSARLGNWAIPDGESKGMRRGQDGSLVLPHGGGYRGPKRRAGLSWRSKRRAGKQLSGGPKRKRAEADVAWLCE